MHNHRDRALAWRVSRMSILILIPILNHPGQRRVTQASCFYISTASIFLLLLSFYCFYLYIASIFLLLLSFYCFYLSIASIFILFLSAPLTCTVLDNETGLPCQKKSFPMTIQKVLNDSDRLSFLRCDEPHFQRKIRCLRSRIFCKNNDSVFLHKIT